MFDMFTVRRVFFRSERLKTAVRDAVAEDSSENDIMVDVAKKKPKTN